jgi:hypothetical protein
MLLVKLTPQSANAICTLAKQKMMYSIVADGRVIHQCRFMITATQLVNSLKKIIGVGHSIEIKQIKVDR